MLNALSRLYVEPVGEQHFREQGNMEPENQEDGAQSLKGLELTGKFDECCSASIVLTQSVSAFLEQLTASLPQI